jgi:hypothetical protein
MGASVGRPSTPNCTLSAQQTFGYLGPHTGAMRGRGSVADRDSGLLTAVGCEQVIRDGPGELFPTVESAITSVKLSARIPILLRFLQ